ncbi:MAG: PIN domain-containing protein [Archaeoglobaceae archaeon]
MNFFKSSEASLYSTKKYGLLPNDALIAATCKHYGIKKDRYFRQRLQEG